MMKLFGAARSLMLLSAIARTIVAQNCTLSDTYFEDVSDRLGSLEIGGETTDLRGASWLDYNNDGLLDLIIPNDIQLSLFKNNGNGNFEEVAVAAGLVATGSRAAVVADFDNDGYQDVILTPTNELTTSELIGSIHVFRNNRDGTFTDKTSAAGVEGNGYTYSSAVGDYDGDGYLDIFMTGAGSSVLIFPENRTFIPNKLYKNNGDFTFTDVTDSAGVDGFYMNPDTGMMEHGQACVVQFTDYDGDRLPDILVANCISEPIPPFYLFKNNGDGTFTDVASEAGLTEPGVWMGMALGDVDNDGDLDVYTGSTGKFVTFIPIPSNLDGMYPHALWRNTGGGSYTVELDLGVPDHEFNWGSTFFDTDNNGILDLVTMGGGIPEALGAAGPPIGNPGRLFLNDGNGNFDGTQCVSSIDMSYSFTSGVAAGDFDGDGYMDLVVMTSAWAGTEPLQVEFNDTITHPILLRNKGSGSSYLTIKLVGTTSNRDAIGAVVKVKDQMREVRSGSSLMSVEQIWPHFGLGSETGTVDVKIYWPSGLDETFKYVSVNQMVTLEEGTGDPTPTRDANMAGKKASSPSNGKKGKKYRVL